MGRVADSDFAVFVLEGTDPFTGENQNLYPILHAPVVVWQLRHRFTNRTSAGSGGWRMAWTGCATGCKIRTRRTLHTPRQRVEDTLAY